MPGNRNEPEQQAKDLLRKIEMALNHGNLSEAETLLGRLRKLFTDTSAVGLRIRIKRLIDAAVRKIREHRVDNDGGGAPPPPGY